MDGIRIHHVVHHTTYMYLKDDRRFLGRVKLESKIHPENSANSQSSYEEKNPRGEQCSETAI